MNIALSYPALNGQAVTEAHAKYCANNGHATYYKDGLSSDFCPRCGADLEEDLILLDPEVTVTEVDEPSMPVIAYECTWTTVEMHRHGAHSEDRVDGKGNVIRWQCQGF